MPVERFVLERYDYQIRCDGPVTNAKAETVPAGDCLGRISFVSPLLFSTKYGSINR